MFRFANIEFLYALLFIPAFALVYIVLLNSYKKALKRFGEAKTMAFLMPGQALNKRHIKFIIYSLAFAMLVIAAARPQFGSKLEEMKREGIEIVLALDISNSMRAEDIKPNRLERAKQAIITLLDKLEDDRIGLIVFAGDAYTQIPLTTDYKSARLFLSNINPEIVSKQGTAIGSAIELAMKSFSQNEESSKVMVIISDGENHEGNALDAAQMASEKGVKIFTIGMGSLEGAPIPQKGSNAFVKDRQGNVVISRMNSEMLSQIALSGGGDYFTASTSNVGLNRLYNKLDKMQKAELETLSYSEYDDQFHYFVLFALILLIVEFLINEKKGKISGKVNLFEGVNN
ncbi:MAG: VWA domain-containing protein [Bacteroidales bacterium]|nr:VWA domain-containing protein [Bacteroidales bacterium]